MRRSRILLCAFLFASVVGCAPAPATPGLVGAWRATGLRAVAELANGGGEGTAHGVREQP